MLPESDCEVRRAFVARLVQLKAAFYHVRTAQFWPCFCHSVNRFLRVLLLFFVPCSTPNKPLLCLGTCGLGVRLRMFR